MTVRSNVIANSFSQAYATLVGILLVPLYVQYMGVEAYGLVGFYAMLQGWFMLLDMGLSPTLGREAARFNGGAVGALELRCLLRSFEGIFLAVGAIAAASLGLGAEMIAERWLRVEQLDIAEVHRAVVFMAGIGCLRWLGALYRSAIAGFEKIVWLSWFNALISTMRFVVVVPYLAYVGASPTHFFAYQFLIAILEAVVLIRKTYSILPPVSLTASIRWAWAPIRGVGRFALSVAFTGAVWVLVTQVDKLLLSGLVPLREYALFTLSVLVASSVLVLTGPITSAVLPRLTKLSAQGDEMGLVGLYRNSTQTVTLVAIPAVLILSVFPAQVLTAWTGQPEISNGAAPLLMLYAIGNGLLVVAGFPYLLQVAKGNLSLHLAGNVFFVIVFVPLLLLAIGRYGIMGAGYAWVCANLIPLIVWLPIVHGRFLKGLHLRWITEDVGVIALVPTGVALVAARLLDWPSSRLGTAFGLVSMYLSLALVAACSSSALRAYVRKRMSNWAAA